MASFIHISVLNSPTEYEWLAQAKDSGLTYTLTKDYSYVFIIHGGRTGGSSSPYVGGCSVTGTPQPTILIATSTAWGSGAGGLTIWRLENAKSGQKITSSLTVNMGGIAIIGLP